MRLYEVQRFKLHAKDGYSPMAKYYAIACVYNGIFVRKSATKNNCVVTGLYIQCLCARSHNSFAKGIHLIEHL